MRRCWLTIVVLLCVSSASISATAMVAAGPRRFARWSARFNGAADLNDVATSAAIAPAGHRVFVTGSTTTGPGGPEPFDADFMTIAYSARTGRVRWRARYDGPARSSDAPVALSVAPDGSAIYVTGTSDQGAGPFEHHEDALVTIAYSAADGSVLWSRRYAGPANEDEVAVGQSVDGAGTTIVVAADAESDDQVGMLAVAYDAAGGERLWVARPSAAPGTNEVARDVAMSSDGSAAYVTGSAQSSSAFDVATIAYDTSSGGEIWHVTYDGPAGRADGGLAVAADPHGTAVYVTGESAAAPTGLFDYITLSYDAATGAERWVRRYRGPGDRDDVAWDISAGPEGTRVYVTGESVGASGGFDYATIAYRAGTGETVWHARFAPPRAGDDIPCCIAVGRGGSKVYVAGTAVFSAGDDATLDFAVVAYGSRAGERRWIGRFDGPVGGHDHAHALAVGPRGRLYVAGDSPGRLTGINPLDYATIAF